MINKQSIEKLIKNHKDDMELLEIILDSLNSFEEYHKAIYKMETKLQIYDSSMMDPQEWKLFYSDCDNRRSRKHNMVISNIQMLNRFAEKDNLPLIYDGIISEEHPYRKEIADAVLQYIEGIICDRR